MTKLRNSTGVLAGQVPKRPVKSAESGVWDKLCDDFALGVAEILFHQLGNKSLGRDRLFSDPEDRTDLSFVLWCRLQKMRDSQLLLRVTARSTAK